MGPSLPLEYGSNNEARVPAFGYRRTWYPRGFPRAPRGVNRLETFRNPVTQRLTVLLSYQIVASVPLVRAQTKWRIAIVGRN